MDQELDALLASSTPSTTPSSNEKDRAVASMLAAAESTARLRRHSPGRRAGLAAVAIASAVGLVDPPWSVTEAKPFTYPGPFLHADELSAGQDCKVVYGASGTEDPKHPVGVQERARVVRYAKEYVLGFDITTISIPEAIASYRAEHAQMIRAEGGEHLPPSELVLDATPDEIRVFAVLRALDRRLTAYLSSKGLSTHAASAMAMPECATPEADDGFDPESDRR